jgi:flagellar biosynthesis anti-sigma factor FlgM
MDIRSQLQGVQSLQSTSAEKMQAVQPAGRNQNSAESGAVSRSAGDETHLSSDAGLAANLVGQAMSLPDVRSDVVAGVQAQLESGSYQVSSSAVAEKMIGTMLEK